MVSGKVAELPARFDIDSGSRSELDLTGPFVKANNLQARFSKGVEATTGWGVGGPSRSYVVRLPSLTLGSAAPVKNVVAGLSQDKGGSISDPNYEGNIGSGFLKRFVVTFDYAHQKMYLQPLQPTPADAGTFDRAGMWLNSNAQGYVVTEVSAGGPASRAGIQVGDVITAVNKTPARPEALAETRTLLRSAATQVQLAMQRDGATRQITLILADQI
jgi:S1-C subfamily serine protease